MTATSSKDIAIQKSLLIPDKVFEVFNKLIAENYSNGSALVDQDTLLTRLFDAGYSTAYVRENGYLNVEEVYRAKGWRVTYCKPGYNKSYSTYFIFER